MFITTIWITIFALAYLQQLDEYNALFKVLLQKNSIKNYQRLCKIIMNGYYLKINIKKKKAYYYPFVLCIPSQMKTNPTITLQTCSGVKYILSF